MSHTGSWIWDVHRAAPVYWSPEMCRFYGRNPSDGPPTSEEYRALLRPEDWANWKAAVQECIVTRADFQLESHLVIADAPAKRVRISGRPIAANGTEVAEIIGSTTEVSNADDEDCDLRPEDRFRQMIDLIPAPAWSSGPDGSVDFLNQSWLEYTGLSMDEARNWGWIVTFHPDDLGPLVEHWKSLLASGQPGSIEARLRRFDGEYRLVLCSCQAATGQDGSGLPLVWLEHRCRRPQARRGRSARERA